MRNEKFLEKAELLKPELKVTEFTAEGTDRVLKKGDEIIFDMKNHYVGYVDIEFSSVGHHMDAPLLVQISFAEIREEFNMDASEYHGWICDSWIQEERVHVDVLPYTLTLNRRYAFRYIKVRVLAVSDNYSVRVDRIHCRAVSSADMASLQMVEMKPEDAALDRVGIRTLHNCMQYVFEDGPKRDRRLWLGDLRLQALASYETFRANDLVKRCLYLFAGTTLEEGRLANNLFIEPEVECDYQTMFDYTLFFISCLWEYYDHTGDRETLEELEPVCWKQYELLRCCFEDDLLDLSKVGNLFVDWNFEVHKQVSGQGIYIACLKDLVKIEETLGRQTEELKQEIAAKTRAVLVASYDPERKLFLSGNQVSYASQVWMVLSGAADEETGREALEALEHTEAVMINSPYLMHYYIEALIQVGMKEKALEKMHAYWGEMIRMGADTFFELFNPADINYSPYGGLPVHSFCHAWSCTPTYFLRKYYYSASEQKG